MDNISDKFDIKKVHEKEVIGEIINLNSKKPHATVLFHSKLLNNITFLPIITKTINERVTEGTFRVNWKLLKGMQPLKIGFYEKRKLETCQSFVPYLKGI